MTRASKRKHSSPGQLALNLFGDGSSLPPPTIKRTRPKTLLYKETDPKKRKEEERLIARHIPLLKTIIGQQLHKYGCIEIDDLYSLGQIGLLKAIRRFDPERGFKFSSIALPFILGEWRHYIRDRGFWLKAPGYVRQRGMSARRLLERGESFDETAKKLGIDLEQLRLDLRATAGMGHEADLEISDGQLLDSGWI